MTYNENNGETITETTILNQKHGNVNGMLFLNEIIGVVYFVVVRRHRCIIRDTQSTISAKNQLNGLFQFANLAMTDNINSRVRMPNAQQKYLQKQGWTL
ncbi:hypothetical protein [Parafilimonas terrae]|uniref:hypothetical protein n=1 Tax=Parafilimonas terrae TaxID=1465490 RepID=UPI0015A5E3E8|nr:hypothetical protein [Parafilimonas terrae]